LLFFCSFIKYLDHKTNAALDNLSNAPEGQSWLIDLLENAGELINIVHVNGTIIYVNKAWSQLLGYSPDEIKGHSLYSFVHPDDQDAFRAYRQQAIKNPEAATDTAFAFVSKTGKKINVEGRISVKAKGGMVLYTTGIFHNVTTRLQQEEKIKKFYEDLGQKQKDFYELLHNAPDAVVLINTNSDIIFWNKKAEEIFGWQASEVLGVPLAETIVPPEYRKAHTEGMKRFLATGEAHVLNKTIDITALNKNGKQLYVSLTISQTHWEGKASFIAFIRDTTAQKKAQLELEEKKSELETSNGRLQQYAHVTSHDMKEPIRQMKVFSSMLQAKFAGQLPEEARFYLEKIDKSCGRLINTVNGVMAFSSVESNEEPFAPIDLAEAIRDIEEDISLLIAEKNATIVYNGLAKFEGVPFLVRQLFYNLISNSLKFSKAGTPCVIEIKTQHATSLPPELPAENAPYLLISVNDNGIGFDQMDAERIFETYTRLNSKDKYEGTGLGLAICKSITERHKGTIKAYSEPGIGTHFEVFLPVKQPQA
jgi:PAS domain S-box-containing protein